MRLGRGMATWSHGRGLPDVLDMAIQSLGDRRAPSSTEGAEKGDEVCVYVCEKKGLNE